MGLSKTVPSKQAVGEVAVKSNEILQQLVDLYKERVSMAKLDTIGIKEIKTALESRAILAQYLFEQGNEIESNKLARDTLHSLVARAEAAEAVTFDASSQIEKLTKAAETKRKLLDTLLKKLDKANQSLNEMGKGFAGLEKGSEEYNALEAKFVEAKKDYDDMIPKKAELEGAIEGIRGEQRVFGKKVAEAGGEALTLKQLATDIMLSLGNYDGASELISNTMDKFFASTVTGVESLVGNFVMSAQKRSTLMADRPDEKHKLLEISLETSLDIASRLEAAIFDGRRPVATFDTVVQFRVFAADLFRDMGKSADAQEMLLASVKEYKEKGFAQESVPLLERLLELGERSSAALTSAKRSDDFQGYL